MRKFIPLVAAVAALIPVSQAAAVTAGVNLLTNSDFEAGVALAGGPYTAGVASQYDKWIASGWQITGGGQAGPTDDFAQHTLWSDLKLVQAIDANALGIGAGQPMKLEFDYILDGAFYAGTTFYGVLGMNSGQQIQTWGGGTIQGSYQVGPTLLASSSGWTTDVTDAFTVDANYDAIAVVFVYSSDYVDPIRGVDNVELSAVPEPITLIGAMMGTGMIAGYLRKRNSA